MITIIAAMSLNGVIGKDNSIPWHIPGDFAHFKSLTLGHPIIMGRKTFDSIGKPLPGRTSIVVTRQALKHMEEEGVIVVQSLAEAFIKCLYVNDTEIFIIGGAEIYRQTLPAADRLVLTEIQEYVDGDILFPEFDRTIWKEVSREVNVDALSSIEYHFVVYEKEE